MSEIIDKPEFLEWVTDYWSDRACRFCDASDWFALAGTFELRQFTGGGMVIGGGVQVVPVIVVTC